MCEISRRRTLFRKSARAKSALSLDPAQYKFASRRFRVKALLRREKGASRHTHRIYLRDSRVKPPTSGELQKAPTRITISRTSAQPAETSFRLTDLAGEARKKNKSVTSKNTTSWRSPSVSRWRRRRDGGHTLDYFERRPFFGAKLESVKIFKR